MSRACVGRWCGSVAWEPARHFHFLSSLKTQKADVDDDSPFHMSFMLEWSVVVGGNGMISHRIQLEGLRHSEAKTVRGSYG